MVRVISLFFLFAAVTAKTFVDISGDVCIQTTLDNDNVADAKLAGPRLEEGTCDSLGYTVSGGPETVEVPNFGEITVESFSKSDIKTTQSIMMKKTTLHVILDTLCLQTSLGAPYAAVIRALGLPVGVGTCKDQGFTVHIGHKDIPGVPELGGDVVIDAYNKPDSESNAVVLEPSAKTTTLFAIMDGLCVQSTVDSTAVDVLKKLRPEILVGTCSSQGYTVAVDHEVIPDVPVVGSLTLDVYALPEVDSASKTTTLYSILDDMCLQSVIESQYVDTVKKLGFPVKEGTCASQGYTVSMGHEVVNIPELGGDVSMDIFQKPQTVLSALPKLEAAAADTVTLYCILEGVCGQGTIDRKYADIMKAMGLPVTEGTCASQGYTVLEGHRDLDIPELGGIVVVDIFEKPQQGEVGEVVGAVTMVDLYLLDFGFCTQLGVRELIALTLQKLSHGLLKIGTCEGQGYTVDDSHQELHNIPVIGDVVLDVFTKSEAVGSTTVDLFVVQFGFCAQIGVRELIAPVIQQLSHGLLAVGTCEGQGYTVDDAHKELQKIPVIGDVVLDLFTKPGVEAGEGLDPELVEALVAFGAGGAEAGGLTKTTIELFSIEFGYCNQLGVGGLASTILQKASRGLLAVGSCKDRGYTVSEGHTVLHTVPGLGDIVIDVFTQPPQQLAVLS